MILSCSTLNAFLDCELSYLNKQRKLPTFEFDYFTTGKEAHKIVQKYISGKIDDPRLRELDGLHFPIVEEKDFDDRLRFEIPFGSDKFIGFLDARNDEEKIFSDIKTSTTLWTLKKFLDLMQRKVYQLAYPQYSFVGITTKPDLSEVYVVEIPNRPKDAEVARDWIVEGFRAIKQSKFQANPDANCYRCVYKDSCEKSKCKNTE